MATHSNVLVWEIPWTEEPGGLQSVGLQSWTQLSTSPASPPGGILKTPKEADAESLQAGWYPRTSLPTPLRAQDILHLVNLAAQYHQRARHPLLLPQELPCSLVCQRLVATFTSVQTVWVLVGTVGTPHLPVTACGFAPMEQRGGPVASMVNGPKRHSCSFRARDLRLQHWLCPMPVPGEHL